MQKGTRTWKLEHSQPICIANNEESWARENMKVAGRQPLVKGSRHPSCRANQASEEKSISLKNSKSN